MNGSIIHFVIQAQSSAPSMTFSSALRPSSKQVLIPPAQPPQRASEPCPVTAIRLTPLLSVWSALTTQWLPNSFLYVLQSFRHVLSVAISPKHCRNYVTRSSLNATAPTVHKLCENASAWPSNFSCQVSCHLDHAGQMKKGLVLSHV